MATEPHCMWDAAKIIPVAVFITIFLESVERRSSGHSLSSGSRFRKILLSSSELVRSSFRVFSFWDGSSAAHSFTGSRECAFKTRKPFGLRRRAAFRMWMSHARVQQETFSVGADCVLLSDFLRYGIDRDSHAEIARMGQMLP